MVMKTASPGKVEELKLSYSVGVNLHNHSGKLAVSTKDEHTQIE